MARNWEYKAYFFCIWG